MKITIREDFKNLIPPLSDAEREQLHSSLDTRGCIDPLRVWKEECVLLDGHNRYEYCTEKNIPFATVEISCSNENVAKNWMILNQLGRRNLSPYAASILRAKLYTSKKKEQGGDRGNQFTVKEASGNSCNLPKTVETVAAQTGVSPRTVMNDAKFSEACEKLGVTQDVISGKEKRSRKAIVAAANPVPKKETEPEKPVEKFQPWKRVWSAFQNLDDDNKRDFAGHFENNYQP